MRRILKRRICTSCGRVLPLRGFYGRRGVCRECLSKRASGAYLRRTRAQSDFVCRQCGRPRRADQASTYATNLCRACHAENLLRKKREAPEVLKCHVCGETKQKAEFEKYSLTRCKRCASLAQRKEIDDE